MNIFQYKKIYFLGIGGIGVSALAKLALHQGKEVYGYDLNNSSIIEQLKSLGAKIVIGKQDYCGDEFDLLIYSTAIPENNKILMQARKRKITCLTYPQALGRISRRCFTIAVSGMHGKSTTTAMIGIMLESAGFDPLVIVGTKVKKWKGNIRINKKEKTNIFVVEADEYKSAMMELKPNIIVLTRIEKDHLDYYKNLKHIKQEFKKYIQHLPKNGTLIANWADKNIKKIKCQISNVKYNLIKYNFKDDMIKKKIKRILKVPGKHNLENALAAYKAGGLLKLSENQILTGLAKFKGTWRRQELIGYYKLPNTSYKLPVISDYAHHPTEIKATLQALREQYPDERLLVAYQPHQHNRTKMLFNDFINAFDGADTLILNEIFDVAGREISADQNISSKDLAKAIIKTEKQRNRETKKLRKRRAQKQQNYYYSPSLAQTKKKILDLVQPNDVIIIMGAGDVDKVARKIVNVKL